MERGDIDRCRVSFLSWYLICAGLSPFRDGCLFFLLFS